MPIYRDTTRIDLTDHMLRSPSIHITSVRVATTEHIYSMTGSVTVDGIFVSVGDLVLVKDQRLSYENGVYMVLAGEWIRYGEFNDSSQFINGKSIYVISGNQYCNTSFSLSVGQPFALGMCGIHFNRLLENNNIVDYPFVHINNDTIEPSPIPDTTTVRNTKGEKCFCVNNIVIDDGLDLDIPYNTKVR